MSAIATHVVAPERSPRVVRLMSRSPRRRLPNSRSMSVGALTVAAEMAPVCVSHLVAPTLNFMGK